MKLTVIGLDGAHWELLKPWIQDGSLPNIAKIIECGVWGDMESCLPPVTLPNWKCYSTGKNPGKIGIFWWENIDFKNKKIYHPFYRKFTNLEIWDYLAQNGNKVGVIGVPGSYPPKKVNGFMIAGGPDAEEKGFTYPEELEEILRREYGFKLRPETPISLDKDKATKEIYDIIDNKFQIAKMLSRKYKVDFLQVTSFSINILHHFLWDDKRTKECWMLIDSHIGNFIKDKNHNIILMSDHGSNKIKTTFNINAWLIQKGYLKIKGQNIAFYKFLNRLKLTDESLLKLLKLLKLIKIAKKVPKVLQEMIPTEDGEVKKKNYMINWAQSIAIASGQGPLYLNANRKQEYNELLKKIKKELELLRDPKTGGKIVEKVYLREELYSGRYLDEAADLILDQAPGVHIKGGIGIKHLFSPPRIWKAENKKWGLFAAFGPDIRSGVRINRISILDLAPTILHMFNVPIPKDMDGTVSSKIFHEQSEIAQRRIRYREMGEKGKVKEKLQELERLDKI